MRALRPDDLPCSSMEKNLCMRMGADELARALFEWPSVGLPAFFSSQYP